MTPSPYRASSAPLSHAAATRTPLRRLAWRTYRSGVNPYIAALCAISSVLTLTAHSPPRWFVWSNLALVVALAFVFPFARGAEKRRVRWKAHELRVARARLLRLTSAQKTVFAAVVDREEKRRGTSMTAKELDACLGAFGVAGVDCERVVKEMERVAKAGADHPWSDRLRL